MVLLIDEVDKADIEFPNDLLRELDRMEFYVYETRELVKAKHRPIVFITSQQRKGTARRLPAPLLLPLHPLPRQGDDGEASSTCTSPASRSMLLREALEVFFEVREVPGAEEEALDLRTARLAEAAARRRHLRPRPCAARTRKTIIPPLHGALLKNEQDVHLFERLMFMSRHNR